MYEDPQPDRYGFRVLAGPYTTFIGHDLTGKELVKALATFQLDWADTKQVTDFINGSTFVRWFKLDLRRVGQGLPGNRGDDHSTYRVGLVVKADFVNSHRDCLACAGTGQGWPLIEGNGSWTDTVCDQCDGRGVPEESR